MSSWGKWPLHISAFVKVSGVASLYLNLLGHFSAGEDPVALECPEDAMKLHSSTLNRFSRA
jgi:hypothetical protein